MIGEPQEGFVNCGGPSGPCLLPAEKTPEGVDWDRWLGACPWRPYNSQYVRGRWRGHFDFHGGGILEWGSHTVDLCQWANQADDTAPVEYEPDGNHVHCRYANGVKVIFEEGKWPLHVRFVGTEGMVYVDDDGTIEAEPKSLLAGRQFGKGYPNENHVRNFLDCVKTREEPIEPVEVGHRTSTLCHLGNIALQLNRALKWDPDKECFPDDAEANGMLSRPIRESWHV